VQWIGMVPEHWGVIKAKYVFADIIAGPFGSSLIKEDYQKSGYKVYGQEQVIPNDFSRGDYYISLSKFKSMKQYQIAAGDILISCVGTFGKIALVPEKFESGIINPRLIKATPKDSVLPEYLQEILRSTFCATQFEQISRGGTMGVINIELLSQLIVLLPSKNEQSEILEHLTAVSKTSEEGLKILKEQIKLLKEYKSSLVDGAVRGKIKV
jgi:type I restriction enzyme S subunit